MKSKVHNGIIGLWKFLFSLIVVALHLAHINKKYINEFKWTFLAGSIVVEFFFIVSGYLMAKKALNMGEIKKEDLGKETFNYVWKKIKAFFPYILITYIAAFSIRVERMIIENNIDDVNLTNTVFDLLLFNMSGIRYTSLISAAWYISAMLISMVVLYPLLLKHKKNFIYIVCPVIVFFIYGYISHNFFNISSGAKWTGLVYKGVLRAISGLSLGCIIYLFSEKIKETKFTTLSRILLTILEIVGFSIIFYMVNVENAHNKFDFVMLLIISICIAIAFSEKRYDYKILSNKFVNYLERLSLPIYLNHSWLISLGKDLMPVENYLTRSYYRYLGAIVGVTIIVSIIEMFIIDTIKNKGLMNKLKAKFVQQ